jgi:riboflavin transporter FmnP
MVRTVLGKPTSSTFMLSAIKVAHTIVWGFFVACIVAVWVFAWSGKLLCAALSIGIVLIEVVVLVLNGLHCPLTAIAARYTDDRRANFDIYLPEWLARLTKVIFGGLYAGGIILTLARWAMAAP